MSQFISYMCKRNCEIAMCQINEISGLLVLVHPVEHNGRLMDVPGVHRCFFN